MPVAEKGELAEPATEWPMQSIQLLRTVQQHHVQLSIMADQKASMLIGATFVVFTIAIAQSGSGNASLPMLVLAISSFLSAGLAALAVMPSSGPKPGARPNPLFFGVFSGMDEDVFTEDVLAQISTSEGTFRAMLHDIYQMGSVLAEKKYFYLGIAYRAFLTGLTLTFMLYVAEQFIGPII